MSGTRGMTDPEAHGRRQVGREPALSMAGCAAERWHTVSLRDFSAVPGGQVYTPVLADRSRAESWFTLFNIDYPLLVGYVFPTAIIRGLSTGRISRAPTRRPAPRAASNSAPRRSTRACARASSAGRCSERRRTGSSARKQRLSTTFTIFLSEIPRASAGRRRAMQDGRIVITERGLGGRT